MISLESSRGDAIADFTKGKKLTHVLYIKKTTYAPVILFSHEYKEYLILFALFSFDLVLFSLAFFLLHLYINSLKIPSIYHSSIPSNRLTRRMVSSLSVPFQRNRNRRTSALQTLALTV